MRIIDIEKKNLKKINSNKEPLMYLTHRQFLNDESTYNRNILLNFSDNGKHGCRFNCPFCSWKNQECMEHDMIPTLENIDDFCEYRNFVGYKVTISGGGDPLFQYEKNKDTLIGIIKRINKNGYLADVITKEIDVVKNSPELKEMVNMFSFSEEKLNPNLLSLCKTLPLSRISIIFNSENYKYLNEYIQYYLDDVDLIYIREDFNKPNDFDKNIYEIKEIFRNFNGNSKIKFIRNDVCSNNYFLRNNEIYFGNDKKIYTL